MQYSLIIMKITIKTPSPYGTFTALLDFPKTIRHI